MNPLLEMPPYEQPTQHAMLVVWGQFAQEIGLLDQLAAVPIPQKTVLHTPGAKLATLFMGLLSGIPYLTDLTRGPAPLYHDPAVAQAWGLAALPEASGVSRTLSTATAESLSSLQDVLTTLSAPFLQQALADLRSRDQPFVLEADLTAARSATRAPAFRRQPLAIWMGRSASVIKWPCSVYTPSTMAANGWSASNTPATPFPHRVCWP